MSAAQGQRIRSELLAVVLLGSAAVAVAAEAVPSIVVRLEAGLTPACQPDGSWALDGGAVDALLWAWGVTRIEPVLCEPARFAAVAERVGLTRWYRIQQSRDADLAARATQLARLPGIERAEVDGLAQLAATTPNDAYFPWLWALENTGQFGGTPDADIDAPEAWDLHTGDGSVIVAVVDTGAQPHPDLQLVPGWNTYNNSANTNDGNGHGTHICGIIGALGNNALGVVGVSWDVQIMPMKCISDGGGGSASTVAAAIAWAADHGAVVENISVTLYGNTGPLEAAVNYAHALGVVLVASVGAEQNQGIAYPARFPPCLAVGTTDPNDNWAYFSVYGPELDLVAPGVQIYSTHLSGGYAWYTGTSFSTAYVSGLAGLVRSFNPYLSNTQVEQILRDSADDRGPVGWDDHFGWGRINAFQALLAADPHGDLNCDGVLDFDDIDPFVLALGDPAAYAGQYPGCNIMNGDCNGDGTVDFDDINAFVARLAR